MIQHILTFQDMNKLYDPKIYPLELEYSDFKNQIYIEDNIYKFNNLHFSIID